MFKCAQCVQVSVFTLAVLVSSYICRHAPAGMHVYLYVCNSQSFPEDSRFLLRVLSAGYKLIFDNDGVQMEDKTRLKNSTLSARSFDHNHRYCLSNCCFKHDIDLLYVFEPDIFTLYFTH